LGNFDARSGKPHVRYRQFSVAKITGSDEEALVGRRWQFDSLHVGESQISDISPDEGTRGRDFLFALARDDVPYPLVGGVESIQGIEIMH
jgi:hypothetical protein